MNSVRAIDVLPFDERFSNHGIHHMRQYSPLTFAYFGVSLPLLDGVGAAQMVNIPTHDRLKKLGRLEFEQLLHVHH